MRIRWGSICIILFLSLSLSSSCSVADRVDPRDSDSPFGILEFLHWNHEWNKFHYPDDESVERAAQMMKEAGVAFVRMDFLWDDVEPQQGKFEFEKYDRIVDILWKHDLKILGLLNYNTPWSAEAWNSAPNRDLFVKYAEAVVKRYKKRVKYWEIWNEPDDKLYWQPQDYMKSYTLLLKDVYPALKKADPTCVIVMGGIAKLIPQSLKHIYANGGKDYFDIANCHPFHDPRLPTAKDQLHGTYLSMREVMEQYGDGDKDLWFTEMGCPGIDKKYKTYGWWLGPSPSEELQARWLKKAYENALKWKGLKKVFWAFFRDLGDFFDSSVNDFGMVRYDFSKKPAYEAYKRLTEQHYANQAASSQ